MNRELSLEELETEHATELPERETLWVFSNVSQIYATNIAVAIAGSHSGATAVAVQKIWVDQQNEFN